MLLGPSPSGCIWQLQLRLLPFMGPLFFFFLCCYFFIFFIYSVSFMLNFFFYFSAVLCPSLSVYFSDSLSLSLSTNALNSRKGFQIGTNSTEIGTLRIHEYHTLQEYHTHTHTNATKVNFFLVTKTANLQLKKQDF